MRQTRLVRWMASGAVALALAVAGPGWAASTGGDRPSASAPERDRDLVKAEKLVADGEYAQAIPLLERVVKKDDGNADAYNLLGYSHRKTGQLDKALVYYKKALAIDPRHRGANEYIGEAYLEMGDVASAKKHLAALDKACFFGCEEYDDLKAAIGEHESRK